MAAFKNDSNIPLSVAVFLAAQTYDFKPNSRSLSATDFNRSIRQVILRNRMNVAEANDNEPKDIASLVKSKNGTAIHDAIDKTWLDPELRDAGLRNLGYPKSIRKRIVVNPDPKTLTSDQIPVYMEIRNSIKLGDWTVSGKFDFVAEGALTDFKSTSTFTYIKKTNDEKYRTQGSIYKVIHKDIISADHLTIMFWFTDWKEAMSKSDPKYPQAAVMPYKIELMTEGETLAYMQAFIRKLEANENTPEPDLPDCTNDELWRDPPTYKYYKNPMNKTRSTKNFDDFAEARKYFAEQGFVGELVTVEGKARYCNYCEASANCTQFKLLKEAGLIAE